MSPKPTVSARVTRRFGTPPERVFDAWLDPEKLRAWMFRPPWGDILRVEIDARIGGRFSFVEMRDGNQIETTGEYIEIDRPRRLVFTWAIPQDSPDVDRVIVEIVPLGAGCELTLTHELHPDWADYAGRTEAAWAKMLNGLAQTLDPAGAMPDLSAVGNVAAAYVHRDKLIEPNDNLALQGAWLKWYNLAPSGNPIPSEIRQLARAFVERESATGRLDVSGDLGFVILHCCGGDFYFLLVSTWRNENELWESVYAKDGAKQADFQDFPFPGTHRGTFCVWELGAVWHEQQAWKRYLLSARDEGAKLAYVRDCYGGWV